jgi:autonomous glycyl radical cofactor GrcA
MATLKLKVSNKILDKVIWLLSQFKSEDLEIIQDDEFITDQKYAKSQLDRLESGKGKTYSIDQVDELLEGTIRQNES